MEMTFENKSVWTYGRVSKVKRGRRGITKILIRNVQFVINGVTSSVDTGLVVEVSANSLTKGIAEHFCKEGKVLVKGRLRDGWQSLTSTNGKVIDAISIGE